MSRASRRARVNRRRRLSRRARASRPSLQSRRARASRPSRPLSRRARPSLQARVSRHRLSRPKLSNLLSLFRALNVNK